MAMTARASKGGEGVRSVLVRAQCLHDYKPHANAGPISGFAIVLEDEWLNSGTCTSQRALRWLEEDLKRVIGAAEGAGLRSYRIEIAPDGTIALVVGTQAETEADAGTGSAAA